MATLVSCVQYPVTDLTGKKYLGVKDFFPDSVEMGHLWINASPKEVLNASLRKFRLRHYLGVTPWIISVGNGRGYLDIHEGIEKRKADGDISLLFNDERFYHALRTEELRGEKAMHLVDCLLGELDPSSSGACMLPSKEGPNVSRVYSDILGVFGVQISPKEVNTILLQQTQNMIDEERRMETRRGEDWSYLANRFVGAEG